MRGATAHGVTNAGLAGGILDRLLAAGVFALPLLLWPGMEPPFSGPKQLALPALAAVAVLARLLRRGGSGGGDLPLLLWPAALAVSALTAPLVSPDALALAALPLLLCWTLRGQDAPARAVERALLAASLLQSLVVLLQFGGADPLGWLGWRPEAFGSARMRVYGTLGNPNFVAAWLCGTIPLSLQAGERAQDLRRRAFWLAVLGVQAFALFATGSRAWVLAAPAAVVAAALAHWRSDRSWRGAPGRLLIAAALATAALWLSPARPARETIEGRLYPVRVAAPHLLSTPLTGYGPGSFETQFGRWQTAWFAQRGAADPTRRFAGPFDHAHNDYLEFWVEYGPLGLGVFLGLAGWLLVRALGRPAATGAAALAGMAALLAVALVDFPFHRPAEWALFWILAGLAARPQPD